MGTIKDYLKKYGKYTFLEKEFTEVDNAILASLSYVEFTGIVPNTGNGSITLCEASERLFSTYTKKTIDSRILAVRKSSYLLKELAKTNRYKDLLLLNYEYKINNDMQFGALCIKLPNKTMYVSFEGTDSYVSGWKEDFMSYVTFPLPAQREAVKYLNRVVKFFGPSIYIGGHSKGGNLALVSAMYCRKFILKKIIQIYSNDGPGLREDEYFTFRYDFIRKKYTHIIPEEGVVGILLTNDENNYTVVKSTNKKFFQHDLNTWVVEDDKFVRGEMSSFTKKCRKTLTNWIRKMDKEKMEKVVDNLFKIFVQAEINDLMDIKKEKIRKIRRLYKEAKTIDKESEKLLSSVFKELFQEWRK